MVIFKKIAQLDKSIKNSLDNFNNKLEKKLEPLKQDLQKRKGLSEEECKKMYIEIMANPEKIDKLYQNINVQSEFIKGNINESQYKKKMEVSLTLEVG